MAVSSWVYTRMHLMQNQVMQIAVCSSGESAARCGDGHDRVVGMRLALRGTRLAPVLGSGGEGRSINPGGSNRD